MINSKPYQLRPGIEFGFIPIIPECCIYYFCLVRTIQGLYMLSLIPRPQPFINVACWAAIIYNGGLYGAYILINDLCIM